MLNLKNGNVDKIVCDNAEIIKDTAVIMTWG